MNVRHIIRKLRVFGVKGALDFVVSVGRRRKQARFFAQNLQKHIGEKTAEGVTVIADFHRPDSLNKVMRDLVFGLHKAGIPFQAFDTHLWQERGHLCEIDELLTPIEDFSLSKYCCEIENLTSLPMPRTNGVKRNRVVWWEFDSGLEASYPHLWEQGRGVIAMSEFNLNYFRSILPKDNDVEYVSYPLRLGFNGGTLRPKDEVRTRFCIGHNDFVVFYNFALGSARKNPDGCVRAFAKAFRSTPDAWLLLKVVASDLFPEQLDYIRRIADEVQVANRLVIVNERLSEEDVYSLTNACDVYFSPHRGEGFGLGIAEAMSLGKPAIVTAWSAPTEFCDTENSFPIGYRLEQIRPWGADRQLYPGVTRWAEPNLDEAVRALRLCYDNRELAAMIGAKAKASIAARFSTARFGESVETLIRRCYMPAR